MRVLRYLSGLVGALTIWAGAGIAADYAVIYGETGQIGEFRNPHGMRAQDFAAPLRAAGFTVFEPKNRSAANMRAVAGQLAARAERGQVDRLVIVALGPMVSTRQDSWILSNDAVGASSLTVGVTGVSVNALSDLAADIDGPVVMLLAPGPEIEGLGTGLRRAPAGFARAERVSYAMGRADRLLPVLDALLATDTSLAEVARNAPREVEMSGHLPELSGLMGPVAGPPSPRAIEQGYWQAVAALDVTEGYQLYLDTYPAGQHRAAARAAIARLKSEPERRARAAEEALNLTRDARRGVQRNLDLLGFDPRGIDGVFGAGSRAAIAAWQRENGFEETGFLNGNQLIRLRDQAAIRAEELEEEARLRREEEERRDRAYWRETGRGADEPGLRAYLERYPDGEYSDIARARLDEYEAARRAETEAEEAAAWDQASATDTVAAYRQFLQLYPNSGFADAARARLRELDQAGREAAAVAQAQTEERSIAGTKVARLLIEQRLAQVGADPGKLDGKFTDQTRKAIRRFQRHANLPVTGYVTRKTMVRLMGGR